MQWVGGASLLAVAAGICTSAALFGVGASARQIEPAPAATASASRALVDKYCVRCHNQRARTGGLALDQLDTANPAAHAEIWERVVEKLRAESMPPPGAPRPSSEAYRDAAVELETALDRAWTARPDPGRIAGVHRLNRTEYGNAVRDLFGIDAQGLDVTSQLPGDETADGSFDKFADVLSISTAHLERYLSVARQVTRLATALPPANPTVETFEIPLHVTQEDRQSEDLPLGSRGGIAVRYHFPVDGEYRIRVRLQRNYQDYLKGMGWEQQLDVRVDGKLLKRFSVGGKAQGRPAGASYAGDGEPGYAGAPEWEKYMQVDGDAGLEVSAQVPAGSHVVAATFVRELWEPEGLPQPLQRGRVITNDEVYMGHANVASIQIGGPYDTDAGQGKGQRAEGQGNGVFICRPARLADEAPCAAKILSRLARLAYRRPVTKQDIATLMRFFDDGRREGGRFETGVQFALERMLVDPDFLLRVYRDPQPSTVSPRTYKISDLELASRLSFFLWSSIPDAELLRLAEQRKLTQPTVLEQQVTRMLGDPRASEALVDDFAAQWLNLRRVAEVVVDPERYPNYDLTLMAAFKRETELFVESTLREDRSVIELLNANYTFVNEKLARHYGIPGVYGSRFRRVTLADTTKRGGLLAHGALLATTSYPDRTSPVLRGKFLLNNILGLQTTPPPAGVDTNLAPPKPGAPTPTIRQRLAEHRTNPTCASCHAVIDPLGFALENFDVIGGWRTLDEAGKPVDSAGTTLGGATIEGLNGLRSVLLERREQFPRTVTEKLLAYALGRKVEYYDRPGVRQIVREAASHDYRWSSLILGIVRSPAFQMRRGAPNGAAAN
jgi:mono/diheme cytochrome c family protein